MKFTLIVEMDNAAFGDYPKTELSRILKRMASKLECYDGIPGQKIDGGKLMDVNGNSVGTWEISR